MIVTRATAIHPLTGSGSSVGADVTRHVCAETGCDPPSYEARPVAGSGLEEAVHTFVWRTHTTAQSNAIVMSLRRWKPLEFQVERWKDTDPGRFRRALCVDKDNAAIRRAIADEVAGLCSKGVRRQGIVDAVREMGLVVEEALQLLSSTEHRETR